MFSNFLGEAYLFLSLLSFNIYLFFLVFFGSLVTTCYMFLYYIRLIHGYYSNVLIEKAFDLDFREILYMSLLLFHSVLLGLCPSILNSFTILI